jgi:adenosylcobinamide-phosphate synthase
VTRRKHRSVNAGWPDAAGAGALGIALAGPRRYAGRMVDDPWIGGGRREIGTREIDRARALFIIACLVHAALAIGFARLAHG